MNLKDARNEINSTHKEKFIYEEQKKFCISLCKDTFPEWPMILYEHVLSFWGNLQRQNYRLVACYDKICAPFLEIYDAYKPLTQKSKYARCKFLCVFEHLKAPLEDVPCASVRLRVLAELRTRIIYKTLRSTQKPVIYMHRNSEDIILCHTWRCHRSHSHMVCRYAIRTIF